MKTLDLSTMDALTGGSLPGSCFTFGLGLAMVATNWYNPIGWAGAEVAMLGAVGCFGD